MPPHSLTNFEVQKYYQNEPEFNGVYSKNNLPRMGHIYIINLDEFNPIQDVHFRSCSRMEERGGAKTPPLPKICHTYPAMIKLGTVIPYLKKLQKIYDSRDTHHLILLTSAFFHRKTAKFAISRNTNIDCTLVHNFESFNFY